MDKIFRLTKVTKFSDCDENFVQRKILSDVVLSDKVGVFRLVCEIFLNSLAEHLQETLVYLFNTQMIQSMFFVITSRQAIELQPTIKHQNVVD